MGGEGCSKTAYLPPSAPLFPSPWGEYSNSQHWVTCIGVLGMLVSFAADIDVSVNITDWFKNKQTKNLFCSWRNTQFCELGEIYNSLLSIIFKHGWGIFFFQLYIDNMKKLRDKWKAKFKGGESLQFQNSLKDLILTGKHSWFLTWCSVPLKRLELLRNKQLVLINRALTIAAAL